METRIEEIKRNGGVEVMKASAGSGKTHLLARTYIRLLMERREGSSFPERDAFRHILAVTFTNKATAQMKSRIISQLQKLSEDETDPDSKYAREALSAILNDYGSFQVTTIDKFFQQVLKAFAREIGQFPDYRIDLDRETMVDEACDRVLDSFSEDDPALLDSLLKSSSMLLEDGYSTNVRKEIGNFARGFLSEIYTSKIKESEGSGGKIDIWEAFSEENLEKLQTLCCEIAGSYEKRLKQAIDNAVSVLEGYSPFLSRNAVSMVNKLKDISFSRSISLGPDALGKTIFKASDDGRACFSKKDESRFSEEDFERISKALYDVLAFDSQELKERNTAVILRSQAYTYRIAGRLKEEFDAILREKHVLALEDSNHLINEILGKDDAPFVYEKLGVRFHHFLLDEFQDTSVIQWENFLPLLRNSIAEGFYNLVVGDVKQSIYRWRNADWKILNSTVQSTLPRCVPNSLDDNWRSAANIVEFNNSFYRKLSDAMSLELGTTKISEIYSGVRQNAIDRYKVGGSVEVSFCKEGGMMENAVVEAVRRALERGFQLKDIAVLVRKNSDGARYAAALKNEGLEVVTNDSLSIGSNALIRTLVARLWKLNTPGDKVRTYFAGEFDQEPFADALSLEDIVEEMLRQIKLEKGMTSFEGDTAYILAFFDLVHEFEERNGNSLDLFLKFWEEKGYGRSISCAEGGNAVTVITIHKAKGLDYPFAIIPLPGKDEFMKVYGNMTWERLEGRGTAFESLADSLYRVQLSSNNESDLFYNNYLEERLMSTIDTINTAYVATTRASQAMHIICQKNSTDSPGWNNVKNIGDGLLNFVQEEESGFVRRDFIADTASFAFGDPNMKKVTEKKDEEGTPVEKMNLIYDCRAAGDKSLQVRITSDDNRKRGTVLHRIMERISAKSDVRAAVNAAVESGDLTSAQAVETEQMLLKAIEGVDKYGWFPAQMQRILVERGIINIDGVISRPDRVVIKDGGVDIIDFKFGRKEDSYKTQVGNYAALYHRMGYKNVRAYLWYICQESCVVEISGCGQ